MDTQRIVEDFIHLASLAGIKLVPGSIEVQVLGSPHTSPGSLPKGKMAVYVFMYQRQR